MAVSPTMGDIPGMELENRLRRLNMEKKKLDILLVSANEPTKKGPLSSNSEVTAAAVTENTIYGVQPSNNDPNDDYMSKNSNFRSIKLAQGAGGKQLQIP
jgi:formylmethanofuran dehydrogenase subunit A